MKKISILPILFCCLSCYSQGYDDLLKKVNDQCPLLPNFTPSEWEVVSNSEDYSALIETGTDNFLSLNKTNDSTILGYYDKKDTMSHLRIRLKDCDTLMYYYFTYDSVEKKDTSFVKGYYQYLFDNRKLNKRQRKFFRQNIDSLLQIRGGNLKILPEY